MKTSRQRVLQYVEQKQVATVRDVSLALKMTPANARHHLSILVDQGSVEVMGKLAGQGKGRRYILYKAVSPASGNNLIVLACILFEELIGGESAQESEKRLKSIAGKLAGGEISTTKQQSKRLNDAIQQLNRMNYHARWEAHHESPHIILDNCPYLDLVDETPEICRMDKYILEKLLGMSVSQTVKLESTKSGMHRCIFILDAVRSPTRL